MHYHRNANTSTPTCRHSFYLAINQTKIISTRTFTELHARGKAETQKSGEESAKFESEERKIYREKDQKYRVREAKFGAKITGEEGKISCQASNKIFVIRS